MQLCNGGLTFPRRKYTGDSLGTSSLSSSSSASASSYLSAANRMEARSNLHRELCRRGRLFQCSFLCISLLVQGDLGGLTLPGLRPYWVGGTRLISLSSSTYPGFQQSRFSWIKSRDVYLNHQWTLRTFRWLPLGWFPCLPNSAWAGENWA